MYSTLEKGATGDEVKKLQELLNGSGYSLSADGVFGDDTYSALQDYQGKIGLNATGVAGAATWDALTNPAATSVTDAGSANAIPKSFGSAGEAYKYYQNLWTSEYTPSQAVNDAAARLKEYEAGKPGEYQSAYGDQIQQMLDSILNREKFSYDFNADPIYQQYAQRYQNQGKLAMMDTMGEAAALTGGYGNTYAQTAGQQAYQGYLQGLNNVIPELYESAYGKYQNTGDQMRSNLSSLQQMESADYNKYTDQLNQYYDELDYFYNKYDDLSDADYAKYMNNMALWAQQRDYWYQKHLEEEAAKNAGRGGGGGGGNNNNDWTLGDVFAFAGDSLSGEKYLDRFDYALEKSGVSGSYSNTELEQARAWAEAAANMYDVDKKTPGVQKTKTRR